MRLIWKKRFGFMLVTYPADPQGNDPGMRVGVYDPAGDMWWFSETISTDQTVLEAAALRGWIDLLHDFGKRQEYFPDGTPVLEHSNDIDNEISIAQLRLGELDHELRLSAGSSADAGAGGEGEEGNEGEGVTGSSSEQAEREEESQQEEEVHGSGPQEDGSNSGEGDPGGEHQRDEARPDTGSESLDSNEGEQPAKRKSKKKRS